MDHVQFVSARNLPGDVHVEQSVRIEGGSDQVESGLMTCSLTGCNGDVECPTWERPFEQVVLPALVCWPSEAFSERPSNFTLQHRLQSSKPHSTDTSPRTRSRPTFMSPLPTSPRSTENLLGWDQRYFQSERERIERRQAERQQLSHPRHSQSWPSAVNHALNAAFTVTPPLTPPEEGSFTWTTTSPEMPTRHTSLSSDIENTRVTLPTRTSSERTAGRPPTISLPFGDIQLGQQGGPTTWLDRALQVIRLSSGSLQPNEQLQMVVQSMPSHAERPSAGSKPVFEEVVELLQRSTVNVPYITITHTYTLRKPVSFEDVPESPPATPNTLGGEDYFDSNTIITHAAKVPDYHFTATDNTNAVRNPRVAPPNSIHVSTVERYIPPTTAEEIQDFFSISRRSHLVDRLSELHAGNKGPSGVLLLVYPTRTGGRTFKKWYKDPVVDPLLRRFMMLRGLTMMAGQALGKMEAVDFLMDFEDMQSSLERLCRELGQQLPPMGGQSRFTIEHSERTEVILTRQTWIELFLAQESSRMRQDLIDYQKSGQRMPSQGFDASPAALAREVEDGVRSSTEPAGGVGIEVGVFVIRRALT